MTTAAGLTASEREQVARRGQRLDETKPGSGLGLSIVVELAGLYGGGADAWHCADRRFARRTACCRRPRQLSRDRDLPQSHTL